MGALALTLSLARNTSAGEPKTAKVQGRVTLALPGVAQGDLGPLVVFLEGVGEKLNYDLPKEIPVISQKDARFSPPFLVVAAGQTVSLANDDRIVHNVFSCSPPKRFDLGLYPAGESKKVTFDKPGPTDLFCSIHSKMNAMVYVAPSPYFSIVSPTGTYLIAGAPPGKYLLKLWCRKLPPYERAVDLAAGADASADIILGADQ